MLQPWTMRPDLLPRSYLFDFIFSQRPTIDKNHLNVNGAFYCSAVKRPQMLSILIWNFQTAAMWFYPFYSLILHLAVFLVGLVSWAQTCNGYYCHYNVAIVIVILIEVVMTRFQIMVSHGGVKKNNPDYRMHLLGFQISQMKPYLEIWRSLGLKCHN